MLFVGVNGAVVVTGVFELVVILIATWCVGAQSHGAVRRPGRAGPAAAVVAAHLFLPRRRPLQQTHGPRPPRRRRAAPGPQGTRFLRMLCCCLCVIVYAFCCRTLLCLLSFCLFACLCNKHMGRAHLVYVCTTVPIPLRLLPIANGVFHFFSLASVTWAYASRRSPVLALSFACALCLHAWCAHLAPPTRIRASFFPYNCACLPPRPACRV
jgi:hypothetical protein